MLRKVFAAVAVSLGFVTCFLSPVFAQWEPDVRLTFAPLSSTFNGMGRKLGASGDTLHVVWDDGRNGTDEIYYKRSTDGGSSWGPDTRLAYVPGCILGHAAVGVSGPTVHVVWGDTRDTFPNIELYYKRSTDGGTTWGPDTRLTYAPGSSFYPFVGVSGQEVHAVWDDQRDGGGSQVYYKRSTDGGTTWGVDTCLTNFPLPDNTGCPVLAFSGPCVLAFWTVGGASTSYRIYYKRSTDGGRTWGPDTCLVPPYPYEMYSPSVDCSGLNVHMVWGGGDGVMDDIYYMASTDGGATWGPDTCLINNGLALAAGAQVAVSASNVHLAWYDFRDGGEPEIYYKRSTDGGSSWDPDTRLTNSRGYSSCPFMAIAGTKVHVVWRDSRDGNGEIYYKRNPTGNSGVEETSEAGGQGLEVRLRARPNPFASFASIPGHEKESFALYDIAGRRVGTYKGGRIGEGLSPGVYFLRPLDRQGEPFRLVKLR